MKRQIEAQTGFNDQVPSGKGLLSFAPQTNNIIDAEQYQDQQLILMLRERAAARNTRTPSGRFGKMVDCSLCRHSHHIDRDAKVCVCRCTDVIIRGYDVGGCQRYSPSDCDTQEFQEAE